MASTTDPQPTPPRDDDEISLIAIVNAVLRHWRVVVVLPVVFAAAAGVWGFTRDDTWAATSSFMPEVTERRSAGGAVALAQQLGVSLGTERPSQSPQFYVDLLQSRTLLRKAVETTYVVPQDHGEWSGTLIEYWDIEGQDGSLPPWRQAVDVLRDALSASVTRETGVVQLAITSNHPLVAEQITANLLQLLDRYNLEVRQSRAQAEGRFIGERVAEAQTELLAAESALQEFLRHNRLFANSPELMFEHDRLQRQVMRQQEVYTSLLRSQDQAEIDAVRDTPLFTIIDHPAGTAEPQGRGTLLAIVLAFILGLILAVFISFGAEFARSNRLANDPDYLEFRELSRGIWRRIVHPWRQLFRSGRARAS